MPQWPAVADDQQIPGSVWFRKRFLRQHFMNCRIPFSFIYDYMLQYTNTEIISLWTSERNQDFSSVHLTPKTQFCTILHSTKFQNSILVLIICIRFNTLTTGLFPSKVKKTGFFFYYYFYLKIYSLLAGALATGLIKIILNSNR